MRWNGRRWAWVTPDGDLWTAVIADVGPGTSTREGSGRDLSMRSLLTMALKGLPGHPLHPPLTDATIGAFTAGSIAVVLAWIGLWPDVLVGAGLAVLIIGIVLAVPTALTGFADYLDLARGEPARQTALLHLGIMVTAVLVFLLAVVLLVISAADDHVPVGVGLLTVLGLAVLTVGGWIGGSLVYVHGLRVLADRRASPKAAILPTLPSDEPGVSSDD